MTLKKIELREKIKKQKINLFSKNEEVYYTLSSQMVDQILQFSLYVSSKVIALFASKKTSHEIYTDSLVIKSIEMGKKVFLPRCLTDSHNLDYIQIMDLDQNLEIGSYSLREPKLNLEREDQDTIKKNFDLVFVPGVAFDLFGNRLGFGSGYYDNFLKTLRKVTLDLPVIGLAFDFQVFDIEIPHNTKDEKVDYIITPSAIFKVNN